MVRTKVRAKATKEEKAKLVSGPKPGDGATKKRRRRWRGRWVSEVGKMSKEKTVIPKAALDRCTREALQKSSVSTEPGKAGTLRIQKSAVDAIQIAAEQYLTDVMELTNELAVLRNRQTIDVRCFQLANRLITTRRV